MFGRLRSTILREPKVILPKLFVCYVISAEYVKVGSGYRLVLSVEDTDEPLNPEDCVPEATKHAGAN
jgi:hypothetical protein